MLAWGYVELLLKGAVVTILLSAVSMVLSAVLGVALAVFAHFSPKARAAIAIYVEIIRSIPLLILVFFTYYGLPLLIGWSPSGFVSASLALTLFSAAYVAEAVRSGISAVGLPQWAAAKSLGLRYVNTMIYVVAPQAARVVIPAAVGIFNDIIKGSSVVSLIGFVELTQASVNIRNATYEMTPVYYCAALYFLICVLVSISGSALERRVTKQWGA